MDPNVVTDSKSSQSRVAMNNVFHRDDPYSCSLHGEASSSRLSRITAIASSAVL